jgi:hypothetical protein
MQLIIAGLPMGFSEVQNYSFYVQYVLLFIYLMWELKSSKFKIERKNLLLFLALYYTSMIPVVTGFIRGYDFNYKPIILSLVLVVALSSKLQLPIKRLLNILILFIFAEYILHFTLLPELHIARNLGPIGLIRPLGPVFDIHLTSLLLVFLGFSCFKNKYVTLIAAVISVNIQAISVAFFLILSRSNFKYRLNNFKSKVYIKHRRLFAFFGIIIAIMIFYFAIDSAGYFDADATYNLGKILIDLLALNWSNTIDPFCLFFGCSYNISADININDALLSGQSILVDVGYLRLLYQFGIPWLVIVFILIWRETRLGVFAIFISAWHYPVAFGLIALPIIVHIVKFWGNPTRKCILPEKELHL